MTYYSLTSFTDLISTLNMLLSLAFCFIVIPMLTFSPILLPFWINLFILSCMSLCVYLTADRCHPQSQDPLVLCQGSAVNGCNLYHSSIFVTFNFCHNSASTSSKGNSSTFTWQRWQVFITITPAAQLLTAVSFARIERVFSTKNLVCHGSGCPEIRSAEV